MTLSLLDRAPAPLDAGGDAPEVGATPARRIAMLSLHTSPLAAPGGPVSGGMNVYVREVAAELAHAGVAVDVFTRREQAEAPEVQELAPGARLVQVEAGPVAPLLPAALTGHTDAFARGVAAFGAREGVCYDVVHSHYWLSALAGEQLAARWNVPHATMFHTLGEVKRRALASQREPEARLAAERRLVHAADRVVAATAHEVRLLRQIYGVAPSRTRVVPLGVDLDRFAPRDRGEARAELGLAPDARIVLTVCRIQPLKGLDILIRALAQLCRPGGAEGVELLIAGGVEQAAEEVGRLRALAEDLGVAGRLRFLGTIPHERLPAYYAAADVVAVPSFYESFGLAAVEAMASGVPVVASRVGGLAATVQDGRTGYLVPWRCPEPFAERIELLLRNEPLRRSLGAAGTRAMRRYAWSAVAAELATLYEDLVREHARPAAAGGC